MTGLPACLPVPWHLSAPRKIATTATSTLWQVRQANGQPAVLKILKEGEEEEARGADYLHSLAGRGAVQVLARSGAAILMEFCPGPSLGDLARAGQDAAAVDTLCDVILQLQTARLPATGLQPLASRFAPLTTAVLPGEIAQAAGIARALLADPGPPVALHGDLHHDNILHSPRGWLAIDPKGVWGDLAYEPANAFRNPEGLGDRLFDSARLHQMAQGFSQGLGLPPRRLLGWAAAHCALSTVWSRQAGQDIRDDLRLLPLLLEAWRASA